MSAETSTMIQNPTPPFDPEAPVVFALEQHASRSALELVMASDNPTKDQRVARFKLLTAALITECEEFRDRPKLDEGTETAPNVPNIEYNRALERARRWASLAITNYENAAMYAGTMVKATK